MATKTKINIVNVYQAPDGGWYYLAWVGSEFDHVADIVANTEAEALADMRARWPAATVSVVDAGNAGAVEATATEVDIETDTSHTLSMSDDAGGDETMDFYDRPSAAEIAKACRDWVEGGEWGDEGARVLVSWSLANADGDEIDSGDEDVEVEADEDEMIRAAGGDPNCRHDWTAEGEGGCDENPGVWSTGGTSMMYREHCRRCGIIRTVCDPGSQRNPGERTTVTYELPDADSNDD